MKYFLPSLFVLTFCLTYTFTTAAYPNTERYTNDNMPVIIAKMHTGSLKNNIEELLEGQRGWKKLVWEAPSDYNWDGDITLNALSMQDLMHQILQHYPLQAIFYHGNNIIVIRPRNI